MKPGDRVAAEQSLLVLESDKATMEIPSPVAGVVTKLLVGVGDKVSEGSLIAIIEVGKRAQPKTRSRAGAGEARRRSSRRRRARGEASEPKLASSRPRLRLRAAARQRPAPPQPPPPTSDLAPYGTEGTAPTAHASPSVRRLARELGVDLALVPRQRPEAAHPRRGRAGLREGVDRAGRRPRGVPIAGVARRRRRRHRLREVRARPRSSR